VRSLIFAATLVPSSEVVPTLSSMSILPLFVCAQLHPWQFAGQTIGFQKSAMFGLSYHSAQLVLLCDYA
jgi:hypothetical protein